MSHTVWRHVPRTKAPKLSGLSTPPCAQRLKDGNEHLLNEVGSALFVAEMAHAVQPNPPREPGVQRCFGAWYVDSVRDLAG
jgi:hypothetical protein